MFTAMSIGYRVCALACWTMRTTTSRATNALLAIVLAVLASLGLAGAAAATPLETVTHPSPATISAPCGDTSGFTEVGLSTLPPEASDTADLIAAGGPYPYPEDDGVFENREGLLPDCEVGYFREYTVETPGSDDRGARRIVTGSEGEHFYTDDHYESFELINLNG